MYFTHLDVQLSDIIFIGDWCSENIKDWRIDTPWEEDTILRFYSDTPSDKWIERRWIYKGLPREKTACLSMGIKNITDAMAFKLRWT